MNAYLRNIISGTVEWRGILVYVSLERQEYVDHLQVESLEPARCPLPITETGYRSHFIGKDVIPHGADPAAYLEAWLDHAAKSKAWGHLEMQARQYSLL